MLENDMQMKGRCIHVNYDGMLLNITVLLVNTGHNEGILSSRMLLLSKDF